jgi:hypothetical protein
MHHGEQAELEASGTPHSAIYDSSGSRDPSGVPISRFLGQESSNVGGISISNNGQTLSSAEDGRSQLLKRLEETVESFRGGSLSKTATISSILQTLGEDIDVPLTESQKETTFDSYLTEILSIQSAFDQSGPTGSGIQHIGQPSHAGEDIPSQAVRKHPEFDGSDDEDESDSRTKRRRLEESEMPWYTEPSASTFGTCNPSCEETRRLLRAYNRDLSKAKFYVRIAHNSPSGIPSSQWERILKGESVDLNHIFALLHHVVPDEERTGRLGDTEITFGVAEPKKRISTAAEWSSTWRRASRAISFAFPHRRDELVEYGDYIESEFAAKVVSSHHKLLLYDVALRNEVSGGQQHLLTDPSHFSRLYSAIVLPDGVESSSDKSTGKKTVKGQLRGDKPEICNKFNIGTCKNTSSACKYRHLCKNCGGPDHGKKDCPDGSK